MILIINYEWGHLYTLLTSESHDDNYEWVYVHIININYGSHVVDAISHK